ncbi:outer membrane beta-barrel protein [Massilia rhizosphaerae]|uniref:outer membrane beta-barrel protein n=1 Tax=Massilia rhizosphaerae TaxID=2784389 RepID=UPI0018DE3509|nr:outer membrane beta-barrel protein [Massilia rhizosphaerae]
MFKKLAIAATLALAASLSFAAAPTGYYGGLDVGSAKIDNFKDSKAGAGGFLGYGFNRFVAIELGYRQLGSWNIGGADVTATQAHVSVVGFFPLAPQFDIYGRLGYNSLRAKASYGGFSYGDDTNGGLYGVGLNYDFTPTVSGRAEVQKPSSDSTYYGVGIVVKF